MMLSIRKTVLLLLLLFSFFSVQLFSQTYYCNGIRTSSSFTSTLQSIINTGYFKTIVFDGNPGTEYTMGRITLRDDITIQFASGVVLAADSNSGLPPAQQPFPMGDNPFFSIWNLSNVTIEGNVNNPAVIKMNIGEYDETPGSAGNEHRHIFSICASDSITIKNLSLQTSGGDGIYLGGQRDNGATNYCDNIIIENVEFLENARNGISIISAQNVIINNCKFTRTGRINPPNLSLGGEPGYGIDIEPNNPNEVLQNITIQNCEFSDNNGAPFGAGLQKYTNASPQISLTMKNNKVYMGKYGIVLAKLAAGNVSGTIIINDLYMEDMEGEALRLFNWINGSVSIEISNCEVSNYCVDSNSEWQSAIEIYNNVNSTDYSAGGITLKDIRIYDRGKTNSSKVINIQGGSSARKFEDIYCSVFSNINSTQPVMLENVGDNVSTIINSYGVPLFTNSGSNNITAPLIYSGVDLTSKVKNNWISSLNLSLDYVIDIVTGDFDNDDMDDIAVVYNNNNYNNNGRVEVHIISTTESGSSNYEGVKWSSTSWSPGSIVKCVAGDFDSDGNDDIAIFYRYANDSFYVHVIRPEISSTSYLYAWSNHRDENILDWTKVVEAVSGDFNSDGYDDIAVVYNNDGHVEVHIISTTESGSSNYEGVKWSSTSWSPGSIVKCVAGDFDNDGSDDIAILYKYSDYNGFYIHVIRPEISNTYYLFAWANHRDENIVDWAKVVEAVPGDFNSDGYDDIAVVYAKDASTSSIKLITSNENGEAGYINNWGELALNPSSIEYAPSLLVPKFSNSMNKAQFQNNIDQSEEVGNEFTLYQNYPNPFNPSTTINYQISEPGLVTIKVFDILGREVKTLVNENKSAGSYSIRFDGSNLASGIYFYRINVNEFVNTRKMLLLK